MLLYIFARYTRSDIAMKFIQSIVILFIFTASAQTAYSQIDPKAEVILQKCIDACGGRESWAKVHTLRLKLVLKLNNEDSATLVSIHKRPWKTSLKMNLKTRESISLYDNGKGYSIADGKIDTVKDAKTLEQLRLSCTILPELYYKEMGYKISALAPETIEGTTYNKLRIESPTGVVVTNYYNAKSGLLAMKYEDNGNKSFVKDYMELKSQGLVFAGTVNKKFANGIDATFILKETDINENIDDKIFHP